MKLLLKSINTQKLNKYLLQVSKLADKDDKTLGNTALYTFRQFSVKALINEIEDQVIGFVQYYLKKKKPEIVIQKICVDPKYRRKGIATLLLKVVEVEGLLLGYERIKLKSLATISANNLYEKVGYKMVGLDKTRQGRDLKVWVKELIRDNSNNTVNNENDGGQEG